MILFLCLVMIKNMRFSKLFIPVVRYKCLLEYISRTMSTLRQVVPQSKTQYISLEAFDQNIYTYTYNIRTKQGALALTGVSAANAAGRVLLRDTGRRLVPGANPGVTTPMISVGFVGASDGLAYNGFIDPVLPDIFALYTEHGLPVTDPVTSDLYTSGVNTTGDITTTGVLTGTGGSALSGGATVLGTTLINASGSAATTIGTGGTGAVNIGNATGNTAVTGTATVSAGITLTSGPLTVPSGTGTEASNAVTINAMSGTITTSSLSTAAGASYLITMTNSAISGSSNRLVASVRSYAGTIGTNGIPVVYTAACTAASTAQIRVANVHGTNALSGAVAIDFIIVR